MSVEKWSLNQSYQIEGAKAENFTEMQNRNRYIRMKDKIKGKTFD